MRKVHVYFQYLLKVLPKNNEYLGDIYHNLGRVMGFRHLPVERLKYYEDAYRI